jgi:hypothetical protein
MTLTADSKKRVVLPGAVAGDVFAVSETAQGLLLKRVHRPPKLPRKTKRQVLKAINNWKSLRGVKWEDLRKMTREL